MPALRQIVALINTALQTGNFSTAKFQDATFNNIGYLVSADVQDGENVVRTVRPVVVAEDGECKDLTVDDTTGMQIYHRNTALAYEDKQEDNFGDPGNSTTEVAEMIIICIGDRNRLKIVQEDVGAFIWENIPRELKHADLATLQLQTVSIEPGEVNVNIEDVWNGEYQGVKFDLKPNNFMLSIKYKITSLFSKKCFKIC